MIYDKTQCLGKMLQGYSGCMCSYCTQYAQQKSKWIVNILGDAKQHEISIVRETNRHGIASWGWMGDDKLLIGSTNHWPVPKEVFEELKKLAKKLAKKLNDKEKLDK